MQKQRFRKHAVTKLLHAFHFPSPPKSCSITANAVQAFTSTCRQPQPSQKHHGSGGYHHLLRCCIPIIPPDTTIAEPPALAEGLEQVTRFTLHCQTLAAPFQAIPFHVSPCPFLTRRLAGQRCPLSPGLPLLVPWHMEAATSQGTTARARGFPSDTPALSPAHAAATGGFLQRGECFLSAAQGQRRAASLAEVSH